MEKLKEKLKPEKRGVSPVIGVILMVAITVILAAVIGAFVLDLGSQLGSTGPQTNVAASDGGGTAPIVAEPDGDATAGNSQAAAEALIALEHKGGDSLKAGEWEVKVTAPSGATATITDSTWAGLDVQTGDAGNDVEVSLSVDPSSTDFTVGQSVNVNLQESGTDGLTSDYDYSGEWTVKVIHPPSNSVVTSKTIEVS